MRVTRLRSFARCAALAVAGWAATTACGSAPPKPQNLIIISIDTLRADHMSLHGYGRATTPNIDELARRAATFDQAIAPWPKTVPSMVSMFSGRYPHSTGIMFGSRGQYVPDTELMLAEAARAGGLATTAVVSNGVLGSATNFNQGFDTYIETYKEDSPFGAGSQNAANSVTLYAQLQLRERVPQGPFLLWVHYVDPHTTYDPPPEFAEPFLTDAHYDPTPLRLNEDDQNFHGGVAGKYWRRNGEREERGWYIGNYDGEIAYADHQIGMLFEEMERLDLWSNTAVIITADHGESLGEHQYFFEHGWFPYHACGWIPWVVYWPGMETAGSRIAYPSSLLNLFPTIVDIMGWDVDVSGMHGRSVVPVIEGLLPSVDEFVIEEAGEGGLRPHEFTRSIQDDRWKLIYVPSERYRNLMQGAEFELYDVRTDPMETDNVADAHPEIVARMRDELTRRIVESGPIASPPAGRPRYTEEELRSLRALGYIR